MIAHIYDPNIYTHLTVFDVVDPHDFADKVEAAIGRWTDLTGYGDALLSEPEVLIYMTADDVLPEFIIRTRDGKTFVEHA